MVPSIFCRECLGDFLKGFPRSSFGQLSKDFLEDLYGVLQRTRSEGLIGTFFKRIKSIKCFIKSRIFYSIFNGVFNTKLHFFCKSRLISA